LTMQPDGRNPSLLKRICVASSLAVLGRRRRGDLGTGGGLSLDRRRKDRAQDLLFLVQCTAHRVDAYLDFTSFGMVHVKGIWMAGIGKRNEVHLSDVIFFLFPPPTLDLPGFACHSPATVYLPSIPMWKSVGRSTAQLVVRWNGGNRGRHTAYTLECASGTHIWPCSACVCILLKGVGGQDIAAPGNGLMIIWAEASCHRLPPSSCRLPGCPDRLVVFLGTS
jgi:hypothetical protein